MAQQNKIQIIKYAPPPSELPAYGLIKPNEVSFIGRTNYVAALEEKKFIFGIKRADRKRHLYIIGKSGVGKTKLQELLARQDIAHYHGICIVDADGEFVDEILDFIPESRMKDVCLIDPSDVDFPVSFNPLANVEQSFKHQFTHGLIEVMEMHFGSNWTTRIEHILRFTILALLDYPEATLRGAISMLTDTTYREKVVPYIKDEMVRRFWDTEFIDWSGRFDTDAIIPLVNKLSQFLSDPMLCNILGQKENKIDFYKMMKEKKIILINLSKGNMGEDNSNFLGALLLIKIKQAGMMRAKNNDGAGGEFYLYMDEFQNLVTDTFESILSESRKYGINLTLAHQYIGQLAKKVQHSVMGNVGSFICFRVGGEDAVLIKPEFAPVFDVKDMINLGIGEFYIKMTIDGESYDPFSAQSLKVLPPPYQSNKETILEISRENFSIPLEEARKTL